MGAPRRKAAARNTEEAKTRVPISQKREAATKNTAETQTDVLHMPYRKAAAKMSEETQTEPPTQDAGVQVSGCTECQSLALAVLGEGGSDCVHCDQVNYLLSLVVDLKEEVERLRTIKECEREIDWWCQSLSASSSQLEVGTT